MTQPYEEPVQVFRYVPPLDTAPTYLDDGQLVHVVTTVPTEERNPDE